MYFLLYKSRKKNVHGPKVIFSFDVQYLIIADGWGCFVFLSTVKNMSYRIIMFLLK